MPSKLKAAIEHELGTGKSFFLSGNLVKAVHHFERAHVLGQRNVVFHSIAHYGMLRVALAQKNMNEILGQLLRLLLGIIGSAIGLIEEFLVLRPINFKFCCFSMTSTIVFNVFY